jgi:hypothetical protein
MVPSSRAPWRYLIAFALMAACSSTGDAGDDQPSTGGGAGTGGDGGAGQGGGSSTGGGSLSSGGGGGSTDPATCAAVAETTKARLLPVDIVWAIDTSGSMAASFPAIRQALAAFSTRMDSAGIDAHFVFLAGSELCVPAPMGSGQCGAGIGSAADSKAPAFLHLNASFGWTMGMSVLLDQYPNYRQMLRADARTHLVLTEDGAPPMSAQAVIDHMEGRTAATATGPWKPGLVHGTYVFSGVVCVNGVSLPQCGMGMVPTTTLSLIQSTGGVLGDLAQAGDPFGKLLDELATKVIAGAEMTCDYAIPPNPGGAFDPTRVNVTFGTGAADLQHLPQAASDCGSAEAWTYDTPSAPSKITLCPAACTRVRAIPGVTVSVEFGCPTQVLK